MVRMIISTIRRSRFSYKFTSELAYGLHSAWRSATERTPSVVPEEFPLWGISTTHRMAQYLMGSPRTSWVSGESGDTSRPNVDAVNSQCDLVVEREVTQPYGYRVVPYREARPPMVCDITSTMLLLYNTQGRCSKVQRARNARLQDGRSSTENSLPYRAEIL